MRKWIIKILVSGFAVALACLSYGFFIEPKALKVRNVDIVSPDWNGPPLRIGLIADLHIGGIHMPAHRIEDIVRELNAQSPDIVLIAGDFVSGHESSVDHSEPFNREIEQGIAAFADLKPAQGSYAVMGNHDDWYDGPLLTTLLTNSGLTVLENDSRIIDFMGNDICLVGLPDSWTGEFDKHAFDACGKEQNVVAFMHSPDSFKFMRSDTKLALAGHTHGGQINIPLIGRRVTATEIGPDYAYGKVDYRGIPAFVTAGVGTSILPARFRAPPEIVLIDVSGPDRQILAELPSKH